VGWRWEERCQHRDDVGILLAKVQELSCSLKISRRTFVTLRLDKGYVNQTQEEQALALRVNDRLIEAASRSNIRELCLHYVSVSVNVLGMFFEQTTSVIELNMEQCEFVAPADQEGLVDHLESFSPDPQLSNTSFSPTWTRMW
jgi:hypothetical protein